MDSSYYFGINNQQVGPLEEKDIRQRISEGTITRKTMAWCQGMSDWRPVQEIPELSKTFGELLAQQVRPPPFPGGAKPAGSTVPPPFPKSQSAGTDVPEGLDSLNAAAYRFIAWGFRPWRGKNNIIHDYVQKDPKRALPVAATTIGVFIILFFGMFNINASNQQASQSGQQQGMQQQGMAPPAGWQAQYQAIRDAQTFSQGVSDDVYKYRRDSQDRMDETYKRANYDWYRDND